MSQTNVQGAGSIALIVLAMVDPRIVEPGFKLCHVQELPMA